MMEPQMWRFGHHAMATEFELIIAQDETVDASYAASAAHAAFQEIDRLEQELSRFLPMSDIARIKVLRAGERMSIGLAAVDCLDLAQLVRQETNGAFDISVAPLMRLFHSKDGRALVPQEEELQWIGERINQKAYSIEADGYVTALIDYPDLDLGALGKGYALDQAAEVLNQWSVKSALLNGGDSSVLAMQAPAGLPGWTVSIGNEMRRQLLLEDHAVSGSGFHVQGAHIMNPRTLRPVPIKPERVWAIAPTAALSDALSTAFMVMSEEEIQAFCLKVPNVEAVTV